VLKADVDRLGALFARGRGDDFGLARPSQLSRMLDAYFAGRLRALLAEAFPDSYTVYAGGDDLMIVAPWRDALRLAARLRADFAAFTRDNPHVTLSAGVALADPRAPLSIAAEEAEHRLERAKEAGRDRVCAIERDPMTWAAFAGALDASETLDAWLAEGRVTTAALYRFLGFDDSRARLARGGRDTRASEADYAWRARFGYHLARMLPDWRRRPEQREVADTLLGLFGLTEAFAGGDARPGARLAISAALYAHR
jgi:CRISPR-associated protein Csm1